MAQPKSGRAEPSPSSARAAGSLPPGHEAEALRALSEGVVLQLATGEVVACNPAAERILGLTRDQIAARTSLDPGWRAIHEDGSPFPDETHPASVTLRTGAPQRGVIMGIHRPDGALRWISINSEPVRGEDGELSGAVTTFADVTGTREDERLLRELLERVQLIGLTFDTGGRVTFANDHFLRLTGWERGEVMGSVWIERFVPPDAALVPSLRGALASGEIPAHAENEILAKDGSRLLIQWDNVVLRREDGGYAGTASIGRDVTAARAMEEAARDQEERFRAIVENASEGILEGDGRGGVLAANRAACRILGRSEEEIRRLGQGCLVRAGDSAGAAALVERERTGRFSGRLTGFRADGTTFPADVTSTVYRDSKGRVRTCTIFSDATEKVLAEAELQAYRDRLEATVAERSTALESSTDRLLELVVLNARTDRELAAREEHLRLAQEAGRVGSFEWDVRADRVVWSRQMEVLHGLPPGGFDGRVVTVQRFIHPDDFGSWAELVPASLASGGDFRNEFRIVRDDGEIRWLEARGRVLLDGEGIPVRMTGMVKDVTELVGARLALEAEGARAKAARKELEAFSYAVSHGLRAPLRAVHGFSILLERHLGDRLDPEGKRLVRVVAAAGAHMGRLIDGLLTYSQLGTAGVARSSVDMKMLAEQVLAELLYDRERERFDVRVADLPPAEADMGLVATLLRHLLANGLKFSASRARPVVEVGFEARPSGTVYLVRDNGVGFDPAHAERLFGVLDRLHSSAEFEGEGIGLALSRRIVERHGGWIRAEGAPGRGATFRFTLSPPR